MTAGDFGTPEQSIGTHGPQARLGILHDAGRRPVVVEAGRQDVLRERDAEYARELCDRRRQPAAEHRPDAHRRNRTAAGGPARKRSATGSSPAAEAIYGTRGGRAQRPGRTTHRGNTVYVFAKDWHGDTLRLHRLAAARSSPRRNSSAVSPWPSSRRTTGSTSRCRRASRDPHFTVIALTLDKPVESVSAVGAE